MDFEELPQKVSAVGTSVVPMSSETLLTVADTLADKAPDVAMLKVMSGEHIAAIVLSTVFGAPPTHVDTDGGVDLEFRIQDQRSPTPFSQHKVVAVEVKSLPGPSRESHARIGRMQRRGQDATGESISVRVESAETIVPDVVTLANHAATSMATKLTADIERHIFVLIHPFDRFAVETYENFILSPALPRPVNLDSSVAQLWVLWVPDQLTVWSSADGIWREIVFGVGNHAAGEETGGAPTRQDSLALIQEAENRFLRRTQPQGCRSPYLFNLTAGR